MYILIGYTKGHQGWAERGDRRRTVTVKRANLNGIFTRSLIAPQHVEIVSTCYKPFLRSNDMDTCIQERLTWKKCQAGLVGEIKAGVWWKRLKEKRD